MGYRSEIGQIGKELLSGYKQIALVDVAIPIYFLDISCFCNKIETLPVIQDTLLRLIDQKFKLTDIPKINENLYASTALERGTLKIKSIQMTWLPIQGPEQKAAKAKAQEYMAAVIRTLTPLMTKTQSHEST